MRYTEEQKQAARDINAAKVTAQRAEANPFRAKHLQELKDRPRTMRLRGMVEAQAAEATAMRADIRQAAHDNNEATASPEEILRVKELNHSLAVAAVVSNNVISERSFWTVARKLVHTERVKQSRELRKQYSTGKASNEVALRLADHIRYMADHTWLSYHHITTNQYNLILDRMRFIQR